MPESRKHILQGRAIALAALVQAARLVDDIARKGNCDAEDFHTLVASLFRCRSDDPAALYGEIGKLRVGLKLCSQILSGGDLDRTKIIMGYVAGLMALEKKLSGQPKMLAGIGDGIERIRRQADYFGSHAHESVVANLAALYGETLSTLTPRIIVRGKQEYLRHSSNTERVRAVLFAGIRAAHLWREHGGSRLTLLLQRKALLQECDELLAGRHLS